MSEKAKPNWTVEPPSLGQIISSALMRSFVLAVALSVAFVVAKGLYLSFQSEFHVGALLAQAGKLLAYVLFLAIPVFLIASSRVWSDRAFTLAGFLATFFGLAMLAVFFVQLGGEVVEWFHFTPILIAEQNKEHQKVIDGFTSSKQMNDAKLAELLQKSEEALKSARTEADRKEILELTEQGIQELREDQTEANKVKIAERSLRPDLSVTTMVVYFLTAPPSEKTAQDSGIGPALWGSVYLGLITILFAVPVGVGAALYLEEYRQEGWIAKVIQVNINNLAGVPSVVYGILGGFVFVYLFKRLNEFDPTIDSRNLLGGGLTLGLLTLPMIIVSAQEAIRAVPSSLRDGAYALGATKWQAIWTIVLPSALPGILTGTILSLSRAIGEAAPLVLFGAQQVVDRNPWWNTPFTALPLQIFQWSGEPGIYVDGYEDSVDIWKFNAAVASAVLLLALLSMNAVAIVLRNRAQQQTRL